MPFLHKRDDPLTKCHRMWLTHLKPPYLPCRQGITKQASWESESESSQLALSQHFVFKPDVRGSRSIMHFGRVPVILRTRLEGPLSGSGATFRNPAPLASPSITTWEHPSPRRHPNHRVRTG